MTCKVCQRKFPDVIWQLPVYFIKAPCLTVGSGSFFGSALSHWEREGQSNQDDGEEGVNMII